MFTIYEYCMQLNCTFQCIDTSLWCVVHWHIAALQRSVLSNQIWRKCNGRHKDQVYDWWSAAERAAKCSFYCCILMLFWAACLSLTAFCTDNCDKL